MHRISRGDSRRIVYKAGGGCLTVFGLLFVFFGLLPVLGALGRINMEGDRIAGFVVGMVFIAFGSAVAFGRYGLILDLDNGTWTKWWGLLIPFKKTSGPIDDFKLVRVTRALRRTKNGAYTVFPVRLGTGSGKSKRDSITVFESTDVQKSRAESELLAKALNLPLEDTTFSSKVVRAPDELDESLRERVRKGAENTASLSAPPPRMRSKCRIEGKAIEIEIPPPGLDGPALAAIVMSCLFFPIFVVVIFLRPLLAGGIAAGPEKVIFVFLVLFIIAPMVFSVAALIKALTVRTIVRASPDGISVRRQGLLSMPEKFIPSAELEELAVAPALDSRSGGKLIIEAVSDKLVLRFGERLDDAEKKWIAAVLKKILTA